MKLNKAISPILATVILIAVTLVIAIGVIGWIMGVWGTLGGPSESLVVVGGPATCYNDTTDTKKISFNLTITNKGTADANISRVEVLGISGKASITPSTLISRGNSSDVTVTLSEIPSCPVVGSTYQVNVYTTAGNVYSTVIKITEIKTEDTQQTST